MKKFNPQTWLEKNGDKTLTEALTQASTELARKERAALVIYIATELAIHPDDIVSISRQFAKY